MGRVIQIKSKTNRWVDIEFKDLKDGNQFRVIDDGKLLYNDLNESVFKAIGEPFLNELNHLTIKTE